MRSSTFTTRFPARAALYAKNRANRPIEPVFCNEWLSVLFALSRRGLPVPGFFLAIAFTSRFPMMMVFARV